MVSECDVSGRCSIEEVALHACLYVQGRLKSNVCLSRQWSARTGRISVSATAIKYGIPEKFVYEELCILMQSKRSD